MPRSIIPLCLVTPLLAATFDVVLVRTAMAFGTFFKVADAFFDVFAPDVVLRVLVAAIAGGLAVVISHMAGDAARVMVAIQHKVFVVVKGCGCPFVLGVALQAITGDLPVQPVRRCFVAGLALGGGLFFE